MSQCEARQQNHLFRQRSTQGMAQLIQMLERPGGWQTVPDQWAGGEGELQLTGWTRKRRAVVFRRPIERADCRGCPSAVGTRGHAGSDRPALRIGGAGDQPERKPPDTAAALPAAGRCGKRL